MEERREEIREQQPVEGQQLVAEASGGEVSPKRGAGFGIGFFLGLIVGAVAVLAITYAAWKIPLDTTNQQVEVLEKQVRTAQDRVIKMRETLIRAQEALTALNEALKELSPQEAGRPKPSPPQPSQ